MDRRSRAPTGRFGKGRTVGVPVTDQDRALEFYLDKLGFEKGPGHSGRAVRFGGRWIEVAPTGAAITIALVPTREGVPTGVETGIRFTTVDAAAVHADLRARTSTWASCCSGRAWRRCSRSSDPDGNGLEIVEAA